MTCCLPTKTDIIIVLFDVGYTLLLYFFSSVRSVILYSFLCPYCYLSGLNSLKFWTSSFLQLVTWVLEPFIQVAAWPVSRDLNLYQHNDPLMVQKKTC